MQLLISCQLLELLYLIIIWVVSSTLALVPYLVCWGLTAMIPQARPGPCDPRIQACKSASPSQTYQRSASGITVLAHLLGLTALVLLIIWLLHYREGLDLDSDNPSRVFNVHPFLMYFGFIFFAAEAMMAYKTVAATHQVQKVVHMFFNLVSLVLGIVGIHAVFKYHDKLNLEDMTSLHSWIGMATLCLFILQWLFGFSLFLFSQASSAYTRAQALPWHINGGRALLYMAICAAETGLMQKATFLRLGDSRESHLVNVLGVLILLFGITVDISVAVARYIGFLCFLFYVLLQP